MSIIIPNMDKPKSCHPEKGRSKRYCPFVNDECDCTLQEFIWETWEQQYENCPLIEVKEGGDT